MRIQIKNNIEHSILIQELTENEVPFVERILTDSTFSSLNNDQVYSLIIIEPEFDSKAELVLKLLNVKGQYEISYPTSNNEVSTLNFKNIALTIYSIVITIICLFLYRSTHEEKNFKFNWNLSATLVATHHKVTNDIVSVHYDRNYDYNFERIDSYVKGKVISTSYDKDEDGFAELSESFDLEGNYNGKSLDSNNDQLYDYVEFILESKDTLVLIDSNANGIFELKK